MKVTIDNPIFNLDDNISPINYVYAGRISNLFIYLIFCFLAIRMIPFMKHTLLLLCLMPMNFTLASSLSYDAIILGVFFLFTAIIFKMIYDDDVKKLNKVFLYSMILLSAVMIQFKQVYFPMIFLFLLIPFSKFESKRQKNIWFVIILASGFISYVLWSAILKICIRAGVTPPSSPSSEQVNFILSSPLEYVHILLSSIINNMEFYFISFVGNLGWLDTNYPYLFIMFYFGMLIMSVVLDCSEKKNVISYKHKIFFAAISIFIVVLIESALYIMWTSETSGVGYSYITGVQGRYFIPLSLCMLIIFKTNIWKEKLEKFGAHKFVDFITPRVAVFSLVLTVIILLLRYWIPVIQA
ncbi:hypothetical protein D3C73_914520 [compost metagenome]